MADALFRQVAVRVELDADGHVGADQRAHLRDQLALAVVAAVGHHRAVQAEQHAVHRQRGAQLAEDLVAQRLPGLARDQARGLGEGGRALHQRPALGAGAPPRHPQRG